MTTVAGAYLRYVDQAGGQKQYKIGGYQDVTFAAAKKKAQHLRSEVVKQVAF